MNIISATHSIDTVNRDFISEAERLIGENISKIIKQLCSKAAAVDIELLYLARDLRYGVFDLLHAAKEESRQKILNAATRVGDRNYFSTLFGGLNIPIFLRFFFLAE